MEIPWTPEEETLLIVMYPYMEVNMLSEHINRSPLSISFRLVKIGMEKNVIDVIGFNQNWIKKRNRQKVYTIIFR
jgi:hypothetical protein